MHDAPVVGGGERARQSGGGFERAGRRERVSDRVRARSVSPGTYSLTRYKSAPNSSSAYTVAMPG